jgi:hypothetical protein
MAGATLQHGCESWSKTRSVKKKYRPRKWNLPPPPFLPPPERPIMNETGCWNALEMSFSNNGT